MSSNGPGLIEIIGIDMACPQIAIVKQMPGNRCLHALTQATAGHIARNQTLSIDRRMNHAPNPPMTMPTRYRRPSQVNPRYANPPTTNSLRRASSRLRFQSRSIGNGAAGAGAGCGCGCGCGCCCCMSVAGADSESDGPAWIDRSTTAAASATARWSDVGNRGSASYR